MWGKLSTKAYAWCIKTHAFQAHLCQWKKKARSVGPHLIPALEARINLIFTLKAWLAYRPTLSTARITEKNIVFKNKTKFEKYENIS